jgi:hypothetical protein
MSAQGDRERADRPRRRRDLPCCGKPFLFACWRHGAILTALLDPDQGGPIMSDVSPCPTADEFAERVAPSGGRTP